MHLKQYIKVFGLLYLIYLCICIYISEPYFLLNLYFIVLFLLQQDAGTKHISLHIVLCIFVYVTNKAYLILANYKTTETGLLYISF